MIQNKSWNSCGTQMISRIALEHSTDFLQYQIIANRKKFDSFIKLMSKSRSQSSIPAFLQKTYDILENENAALQDIVSWNDEGTGFLVKNVIAFQDQVLPMYFKHRNFASFVRQMNMYGFHKSRSDFKENEFVHPYFKKDQRQLLKKIKRKSGEPNDDQFAIMELKPHRNHQSSDITEIIKKHNELEQICKILIDQNNKILECNKQLRNQLLNEKQKGQRKRQKIQEILFRNHEAIEDHPYYPEQVDKQQKRTKKKLLNLLHSDDEDDSQRFNEKLEDSDSTIDKAEQLMLTNGEPQLMLTNEEHCNKVFLADQDLSHQFVNPLPEIDDFEEICFE